MLISAPPPNPDDTATTLPLLSLHRNLNMGVGRESVLGREWVREGEGGERCDC
jgi:hypothetical protein